MEFLLQSPTRYGFEDACNTFGLKPNLTAFFIQFSLAGRFGML
jgi:hypothetical protein